MTIDEIHASGRQRILYLPHAVLQMSHPNRMIGTDEIEKVIFEGEIIEAYPQDSRGKSCLMLGLGEKLRPIHVVCSPKVDFLAIITAYHPSPDKWDKSFKNRI